MRVVRVVLILVNQPVGDASVISFGFAAPLASNGDAKDTSDGATETINEEEHYLTSRKMI